MVKIEPHDLLIINSIDDLIVDEMPNWAQEVFPNSLTVVVRRSGFSDQKIPVGIRGQRREHRLAAYVLKKNIKRIITPYDLVQGQAWKDVPDKRRALPAIKALPEIAEILKDYQWGISGSVGFELATKTNTAKMTSDLDLIWKPTNSLSKHEAQALLMSLNKFGVHADLQVIEGNNGFSLEEYANANSTVMMKTLNGPILVQDPWNIEE